MTDHPLKPETKDKLAQVSVATLSSVLFKKGLRHQVLQDVRPVKGKGKNMVGPAFTLRYIPAREDRNQMEVFRNPQHPYTKALLKTVPSLSGERAKRLTVIEGQPPILSSAPSACSFRDRCPQAMSRCGTENPTRYGIGNGHDAACFLVKPEVAHV